MRTFYDLLKVPRNATGEQILVAYRQRCLEVHPDKGGSDLEFINVKRAFEVLSDPQKRAQYDTYVLLKEKQELEREIEKLREERNRKPNTQTANNTTRERASNYAQSSYCDNNKKSNDKKGGGCIRDLLLIILVIIVAVALIMQIPNFLGGKPRTGVINTEQKAYSIPATGPKETKPAKKEDAVSEYVFNVEEAKKLYDALALKKYDMEGFGGHKAFFAEMRDSRNRRKLFREIVDRGDFKMEELNAYEKKMFSLDGILIYRVLGDIKHVRIENSASFEDENTFAEMLYSVDGEQRYVSLNSREDLLWKHPFAYPVTEGSTPSQGDIKVSTTPDKTEAYTETKYRTGERPYSSYYRDERDKNSLSELTISNLTSTDAVVLLVSFSGKVTRNVFISQDSEYTMTKIPGGLYKVKVMYGNSWNSDKDNGDGFPRGGFMRNVSFSETQSSDPFDFIPERKSDGVSYPTYSMTLHKVQNGNLNTKKITKGDFFQ